jgi:hypothetical protein
MALAWPGCPVSSGIRWARSTLSEHIDHLVFIPPPLFFAPPSVDAPKHSYFAIDSAAIRRLLRVPNGVIGAGVKVALVDSGFFKHPYYAANNLDYRPMPLRRRLIRRMTKWAMEPRSPTTLSRSPPARR